MRWGIGLLLLIIFWVGAVSASSTDYPSPVNYTVVYVTAGDTVWNIAARYVTAKEDVRDIIFAIQKVNNLNHNAQIYPGQALKVPTKAQGN